ncbi:ROK family protein [Hydrogenimonas cancrithermarum]|uniref:NagC family transcriptional regulator n=1 Tax=Hydrogenimonas cancrithermarum TaxID=2993563 RepID=A0ABN6WSH4_9BACT|nr:ROK family protein [Hydrogenimonas cancrithermarum]BDY11744.1 NagC family transcriptional regulator [Hydrogenimonas cancrithermarum]
MSRLAIDAGGTWLRYELVGKEEVCGKFPSRERELSNFIESMIEKHPDIDAIAVSFAGQVHEGVILSAPNIEVEEPEIETFVETRLGIPLRIENDLNCAALAESVYWNEKELAALYSGTGLGGGIVTGGEILHGWRSLAGEVGHLPYKEAPFRCGCGKNNCLELYASGSGIKKWMDRFGCGENPDLQRLRLSENENCRGIAETYTEALLYAAAAMVTLLNPKILVLGGGVVTHNPDLVDTVRERIGNYALAASCVGLRVEMTHIENASLEGAKLLLDTM